MSRPLLNCLTLLLLGALAVSSDAEAQTLDLDPEQVERIRYPGATAVFAVDATVAAAAITGDLIAILGRSPGSTHVVIISPGRSDSIMVTVGEPVRRTAVGGSVGDPGDTVVSGTLETRYLSEPRTVQSTIRYSQQRGARTTELLFGASQPLEAYRDSSFAIPLASYRIRAGADEITFLDRMVDNSPLTVTGVNIRGVHARRGPWRLHAGYNFFSSFENLLLPTVREGVGGIGYRYESPRGSFTPNVYYFRRAETSDQGGLLGTLMYESRRNSSATLRTEVGISRTVAGAANLEVRTASQQFSARAHFAPADHPSLSVGQVNGRTMDLVWLRPGATLTLGANVSAHQTGSAVQQTTTLATVRADYQIDSHWTVGARPGYSFFQMSQSPASRIERVTAPLNLGLSAGPIDAHLDYELSQQTGGAETGHSFQGAVQGRLKSLTASARFERQMHAPTVDQIVAEAPWLQPLLDRLATTALTTAQLAELIRTTTLLSAAGYSSELTLNVAPLLTRTAFTIDWTGSGKRRPYLGLSTLLSRQDSVTARLTSTTHTLTYSQNVGSFGDAFVTWSSVCAQLPASRCQSVLTASLSQNLPGVVKNLLGRVRPIVVEGRLFQDDAAGGYYVEGMPPLANVEVVLDGTHRTRTDAAGRFRFKGVPEGRHRVEAKFTSESPYFYTGPNPAVVREGAPVQIGVAFSRARLFGVVANDVGTGIGDAIVEVVGPGGARTARTGGDGTFTFDGLQAGSHEVRLEPTSVPAGYPVQNLKPQTVVLDPARPGRVEFVLRPLRSILGSVRVYDTCTAAYVPVGDVEVTVSSSASPSITDAAGRFAFRDLPSGSQTLTATHAGRTATVAVTLADGAALMKDVTLTLAPVRESDSDTACAPLSVANPLR